MKKIYIIIALILFSVLTLKAQDYSTMITAGDTPQANMLNPGYLPKSSFIGVPLLGNMAFKITNSFSLSDVVHNKTIKLSNIPDDSHVNMGLNLDVISFGIKFREKNMITFSNSVKVDMDIMYPTGIFDFMQNNPIGATNSYDVNFKSNITAWNETAIGYTRQIDDNWSAGVKVKYLIGLVGGNSNSTNLQVDKTAIDSYTVKGDVDILVGGYDIINQEMDVDDMMHNRGWGFDFGAHYQADDNRWSAGVSVLDLGYIKWSNATQIKSVDPTKSYTFTGLDDLESVLDGGDLTTAMDDVIDSMLNVLELDTICADYKKATPTTIHIGGRYDIDQKGRHSVSGNFLAKISNSSLYDYSVTAGYTYSSRSKNFKLMGSLINRKYDPISLGLGIMGCSRGFQFYMMTETSMSGFGGIDRMQNMGLRLGMNILIGKYRYQNR